MIDLRHNKIESIPRNLFGGKNFQNLKTLDLSNNQILEFELWPFYLNRISINLMNNSITKLTNKLKLDINSFINTCHYKNISLGNNKIQNFNDYTLTQYNVTDFENQTNCFKSLILRNNPIKCNCSSQSQLIRYSRSLIEHICQNSESYFNISTCYVTTSSRTPTRAPSTLSTKYTSTTITSSTLITRATSKLAIKYNYRTTTSSKSKTIAPTSSNSLNKTRNLTPIALISRTSAQNTSIVENTIVRSLSATTFTINILTSKNIIPEYTHARMKYIFTNKTAKKNTSNRGMLYFLFFALLLILILLISAKVYIEKKKLFH